MSGGVGRVGDLEIAQDDDFQHLNWKIQRRLWAGMAGLLALGLLGLFGSGGRFSSASVGDERGPFRVRYERFGRADSSQVLEIDLSPGPAVAAGGTARVSLGREFLDAVQVERIEPPPDRAEAGPDGATYTVRLLDPSRSSRLTIYLRPVRWGVVRGRVGLEGGPTLDFVQWIYP